MNLKSALMTLSLAAALPAFGEPNPDKRRLLRRDPHPHQLVGGRMGHGQPHHRAR